VFPDRSGIENTEAALDLLSRYAIAFRYPGEQATSEEAKAAVKALEKVRKLIKNSLKK
jgi:HEPN domain-containing protein